MGIASEYIDNSLTDGAVVSSAVGKVATHHLGTTCATTRKGAA